MIAELYELRTIKDVFDKVNEVYPNWIIDILDDYADEYECLKRSWIIVLEEKKIPRQKIIVISDVSNEDQMAICELLSSSGFLVRTKDEIQPCGEDKCGLALITQDRFNHIKAKNTNLPVYWRSKCQKHYTDLR